LLYFKYANFFIENVNDLILNLGLSSGVAWTKVALPIGISFFTFQSLTNSVDVYREIMEKDVVMLLTSDASLRQFPWGFDDTATKAIFNHDPMAIKKRQDELDSYVLYIKSQATYMDMIRGKALAKNISVDAMLKLEAQYIYDKKRK